MANDPVSRRSVDAVGVTDMEEGAILSEVHQRHQYLLFNTKFASSSRLALAPGCLCQRLDHHRERFWLHAR